MEKKIILIKIELHGGLLPSVVRALSALLASTMFRPVKWVRSVTALAVVEKDAIEYVDGFYNICEGFNNKQS